MMMELELFDVVELEIDCGCIQALAAVGTMIIAAITAWFAYKKFLASEILYQSMTPEDNLVVFQTRNQTTELKATDTGLELFVHDNRPNKRSGRQWLLDGDKIKDILEKDDYSATDESKFNSCGVFSIGPRKNWLYSKNLYKNKEDLVNDIQRLLKRSQP